MEEAPRSHALAALLLLPVLVGAYVAHGPLLVGGFWGTDDWSHLQQAALVADGRLLDAFQLRLDIYVGAGQAALRQVATLLWGVDFALFGLEPRAYYRTNLLLHLALAAGVWAVARQWRLGAVPAATAAALYAFQPEIAETIWFLAARSEQLAHLFCLSALLLWPRLRSSVGGGGVIGLLWILALFSKTTAGWLPLALIAWEALYGGPEARRPSAVVRRFWGLGVAAVLYVAAIVGLLDVGTTLSYGPDGGVDPFGVDVRGLLSGVAGGLLLPTWQPGVNPAPSPASWARAALMVATSGAGLLLARGDGARRLALAGAVVLAGLALPAPVMARGMDAGRYLVPSAVGLALLCACGAAALPRRPRIAACLALVIAAGSAFLSPGGAPFRIPQAPDLTALVEGARALDPDDRRTLRVGLQHPDPSTLRMLARESLVMALVPGVEHVEVFLEGDGQVWKTSTSEDPTYLADCHEFLRMPDRIGARTALRQDGPRWVGQRLDRRRAGPAVRTWRMDTDADRRVWADAPAALAMGGARPLDSVGDGVRWRGTERFGAERMGSLDLRRLRGVRAHGLGLDPVDYCGLRVTLKVSAPQGPPVRCEPIEPRRFALLTWGRADGPGLGPHAILPLDDTDDWQSIELDLAATPSWIAQERVDALALIPTNTGGEAIIGSVDLLGCGDESG